MSVLASKSPLSLKDVLCETPQGLSEAHAACVVGSMGARGRAQVELLAKSVLDAPVEIQVGGRSVVNADITQVRPPAPGMPTLRSARAQQWLHQAWLHAQACRACRESQVCACAAAAPAGLWGAPRGVRPWACR